MSKGLTMADKLQGLHDLLAEVLAGDLDRFKDLDDKPTGYASILKEARELLKQNNIGAIDVPDSPTGKLREAVESSNEPIPFPRKG